MPHPRVVVFVCLLSATLLGVRASGAPANVIAPTPLPDPGIPGFAFPESEATLTRWITAMSRADAPDVAAVAFEQIHRHGWGLWTALTTETGAIEEGQPLRVFETWQTLDEISTAPAPTPTLAMPAARSRVPLRPLAQLRMMADEREPATTASSEGDSAPAERVLGFVKFDPSGAEHIRRQQLWQKSTLDTLLEAGAQQVPPFPATTLTVKPIFQVLHTRDLVAGRYYLLRAWAGPPATARIWAPSQWPGAVWIDVLDGGNGHGAVDPLPVFDGSTRTDATTYPLASLLHHRLSAEDAAFLNADRGSDASSGDIALLVGMHVSGREIARWTWQTFWWTPNPENPGAPSSARVAQLRPEQLRGAARNYAMALGYTMLSPDQPYTGGTNTSPAVYVYNPWLEARLGPADLPDSLPGLGPDGQTAGNNYGVQSNCMSCHAQANYNPNQRTTAPRPTGARYVDVGAAEFVGTLQVDFLWSLARHAK